MRRYAARYYISGPDRDALVAQTVTALTEEPEILSIEPAEEAIAVTMHRLFCGCHNLSAKQVQRQTMPHEDSGAHT